MIPSETRRHMPTAMVALSSRHVSAGSHRSPAAPLTPPLYFRRACLVKQSHCQVTTQQDVSAMFA